MYTQGEVAGDEHEEGQIHDLEGEPRQPDVHAIRSVVGVFAVEAQAPLIVCSKSDTKSQDMKTTA